MYRHHDCVEEDCRTYVRAAHARTVERHRRSVMGKIIRAGRPAPSIRALPMTSPRPALTTRGGWNNDGPYWIDEAVAFDDHLGSVVAAIDVDNDGNVIRQHMGDGSLRYVGEHQPRAFDIREYEGHFVERPSSVSTIDAEIRQMMRAQDEARIVAWRGMLERLPEPPEGQAWSPVLESDPPTHDWSLRANDYKIVITERLRAELRPIQ